MATSGVCNFNSIYVGEDLLHTYKLSFRWIFFACTMRFPAQVTVINCIFVCILTIFL